MDILRGDITQALWDILPGLREAPGYAPQEFQEVHFGYVIVPIWSLLVTSRNIDINKKSLKNLIGRDFNSNFKNSILLVVY